MTSYEEESDFYEPNEDRFSPRLSLLIIVSLSAVGWWLLLPILSALISHGVYMMIAIVVFGLVRILQTLFKESTRGVVPGGYYLSD